MEKSKISFTGSPRESNKEFQRAEEKKQRSGREGGLTTLEFGGHEG